MSDASKETLPSGRVLVDLGESSYYTGGMRFCLEDADGDTIAYARSRGAIYALDRGMDSNLLMRSYRFIRLYVFPNIARMTVMDFQELNELPGDILKSLSPKNRDRLLKEEKKDD